MAEDLLRYDMCWCRRPCAGSVKQGAGRGRSQAGLPGEHHFYIAFDTAAPGVRISSRIRQKYPRR
jgi:hypothetical protein